MDLLPPVRTPPGNQTCNLSMCCEQNQTCNVLCMGQCSKKTETLSQGYFFFLNPSLALAGVAQWIEHGPENQRVASLIPSQGTCLGCRPGPQ